MAKIPMKNRIKNFMRWVLDECKDKTTLLLLLCVAVIVYSPVWGGYLLHFLFGWKWCSAVASACLIFWSGPFTPFFPICIGITLWIKRRFEKKQDGEERPRGRQWGEIEEDPYITYSKLFWLFLAGSVAGVLIEGVFCVVKKGHWESHVVSVFGALNILYGLGAVIFYVCAVKLREKHLVTRVLFMTASATVLELCGGLLLRYGLGMRAWNYEHQFMNYKGIICLNYAIGWGVVALVMCLSYTRINNVLSKFQGRFWGTACVVLTLVLVVDLYFTGASILRWSERHYGIGPRSRFAQEIDIGAPDDWMQSRFVEWKFLK